MPWKSSLAEVLAQTPPRHAAGHEHRCLPQTSADTALLALARAAAPRFCCADVNRSVLRRNGQRLRVATAAAAAAKEAKAAEAAAKEAAHKAALLRNTLREPPLVLEDDDEVLLETIDYMWKKKVIRGDHEFGVLASQIIAYVERIAPGVSQAAYDLFVGDVESDYPPPSWPLFAQSVARNCRRHFGNADVVCINLCWSVVTDEETGRPCSRGLVCDRAFSPEIFPTYASTIDMWDTLCKEDPHWLLGPVIADQTDHALTVLAGAAFVTGRDLVTHRILALDLRTVRVELFRTLIFSTYHAMKLNEEQMLFVNNALFPGNDFSPFVAPYCLVIVTALMKEKKAARDRGWCAVQHNRQIQAFTKAYEAVEGAPLTAML